jgi:regulator of extracellular matrix RemA (YlzA/DUF370 family)
MESHHSIDSLRTLLKTLRVKIEALEAIAMPSPRNAKLRKLIEEAKRQEAEILAKLSYGQRIHAVRL